MGGKHKGAAAGLSPSYSFQAYAARVKVDLETGEVRVVKVWAAHDCGRALNPLAVTGQIEGCIHMGLGQVLVESMDFNRANIENPNLLDYRTLSPKQMPQVEVILVETNDPEGPFGAKEAGEGPLLPILPAVANAIYDAIGVRFYQLPITPDRVIKALDRGRKPGEAGAARRTPRTCTRPGVKPVLTLAQRCPYPDCGAPFAAAPGDHGHQIPCPTCGRKLVIMDQATVGAGNGAAQAGDRSGRAASAARSDREAMGIDQEERRDPELIALLENVRSLWNVGSMFRTADGAGFGRLVLTGITAAPPRPEIAKTALGADAIVPWEYEADPEAAARRLLDSGFRLLALETSPRSRPLAEIDCRGPLCLVVGHEVAGISGRLLALAADVAFLPMRGRKSSLNVAVAFGIAAYHLATAREQSMIAPRAAAAI